MSWGSSVYWQVLWMTSLCAARLRDFKCPSQAAAGYFHYAQFRREREARAKERKAGRVRETVGVRAGLTTSLAPSRS